MLPHRQQQLCVCDCISPNSTTHPRPPPPHTHTPPHTHRPTPSPAFLLLLTVGVYTKIRFDGPFEYGPGFILAALVLVLLVVKAVVEGLCINYQFSFPGDGYLAF